MVFPCLWLRAGMCASREGRKRAVLAPRSVLPMLENGGRTPSKKALALRSASCQAARTRPREEMGELPSRQSLPLIALSHFITQVCRHAKSKQRQRACHLGRSLGGGDHVVIAPNVEEVGLSAIQHQPRGMSGKYCQQRELECNPEICTYRWGASGGTLAELVGAHSSVATERRNSSRAEG